jgi:signal transduction histidine kinase
MKASSRPRWLYYSLVAGIVVFVLEVSLLFPPLEHSVSALFLAAVAISAWVGGLGPGLLATALSVLALDYFFMTPVFSLGGGLTEGVRLGIFGLVAVLVSSLHEVRVRLEASLRRQAQARDQFLAVLAHELRTPLAAILNGLEVLRRCGSGGPIPERTRGVLERQARHMGRLINDLLDVSRIERGKVQLCKKRLDLVPTVVDAVEIVSPLIEERRHHLEVVLPPAPVYLNADPTRLKQIIVNLLTNAAKYSEAEGRICLVVQRRPGEAVLRVRDTGIGLAADSLPHIFELFGQAKDGSQGGLGIGLHLVRGLVRLHGGSVIASSAGPGQGSEFVVRMPLCEEPLRAEPADSSELISPAQSIV